MREPTFRREYFILCANRQPKLHKSYYEPQIIHFSGHGSGEEGLVFADGTGQVKLVEGGALVGLFGLFAEHVKCVVLNACYSEVQARAIAKEIDYVIGRVNVSKLLRSVSSYP